jgi:spore coat polysaccharide biosynthesis protein SpsF
MDITAIIQARMSSTRLPGKILMEVMGRPLLSYLIEQLAQCRLPTDMIIATTKNEEDDRLSDFAEQEGLKVYRGSERDVLDRYYQAALEFGAEHIMRITADCPLIQPDICDWVADVYTKSSCDYARTGESFAEGVDCEVFSCEALDKAWKEAKFTSEREHVTLYFRNNPEIFRTVTLDNESNDSRYRITVDEKEDFQVVRAVLENLYQRSKPYIKIEAIKSFLDSHPEIYSINAHIIRNEGLIKSLQEDKTIF